MAVVLGAVISAVVAGAYTAQSLGYKVSRVDLLDPKSDYNKLWIDYIHEFGEDDDAVIVVEGESRDGVIAVLEEVSREVRREESLFRSVLHEVDLSRIRSKGLHYLSPADLKAIDRFIERMQPVLDGRRPLGHPARAAVHARHGDRLSVVKYRGGVTATEHRRHAEFPTDDRCVRGAAAPVGNDRSGPPHDRHPVRVGELSNQHVAVSEAGRLVRSAKRADGPRCGRATYRLAVHEQRPFATDDDLVVAEQVDARDRGDTPHAIAA
jgi:hypothetical protein